MKMPISPAVPGKRYCLYYGVGRLIGPECCQTDGRTRMGNGYTESEICESVLGRGEMPRPSAPEADAE